MTKHQRVLVVEPDEQALAGIKAVLEGAGYRVVAVPDAESAAAIFHYLEPDLIAFAYPARLGEGSSGLAEYVRRNPAPRPVRLLAMVSRASRAGGAVAREALLIGCDAVCARPARAAVLLQRVAELIGPPGASGPSMSAAPTPTPLEPLP